MRRQFACERDEATCVTEQGSFILLCLSFGGTYCLHVQEKTTFLSYLTAYVLISLLNYAWFNEAVINSSYIQSNDKIGENEREIICKETVTTFPHLSRATEENHKHPQSRCRLLTQIFEPWTSEYQVQMLPTQSWRSVTWRHNSEDFFLAEGLNPWTARFCQVRPEDLKTRIR
jgi:hypothetical protein